MLCRSATRRGAGEGYVSYNATAQEWKLFVIFAALPILPCSRGRPFERETSETSSWGISRSGSARLRVVLGGWEIVPPSWVGDSFRLCTPSESYRRGPTCGSQLVITINHTSRQVWTSSSLFWLFPSHPLDISQIRHLLLAPVSFNAGTAAATRSIHSPPGASTQLASPRHNDVHLEALRAQT